MSQLSSYVYATRDLLNDPGGLFWTSAQVNTYVNRARKKVAIDTLCIRSLPPSTGSIATAVPGAAGSGYTSPPTVTISAPDGPNGGTQAVITANAPAGGAITGYTIVTPGTGYVAPPVVTVSGGGGANATCVVTLTALVSTVTGQEIISMASMTPALQLGTPGVLSAIGILSISASWGAMKPTLNYASWGEFQAKYRAYNVGNNNYPEVWAQYGRGATGLIYLWPIPAQNVALEVDCICLPIDLVSDATVDVIPDPYSDAVPYYAAHLAYLNAQRKDDAEFTRQSYLNRLMELGPAVIPPYAPSAYDGDF
jgi:hypothetical protein